MLNQENMKETIFYSMTKNAVIDENFSRDLVAVSHESLGVV